MFNRAPFNGLPFNWYEPLEVIDPTTAWVTFSDLLELIRVVEPDELGFVNYAALNAWLDRLIARSQSHVAAYLKTTFDGKIVPEGVKEGTLRLAANLYSYALKTRRGPLTQVAEFEMKVIDDAVFTKALQGDLALHGNRPLGVLTGW